MPKLVFYMTPAYGRSTEKILAVANKGRKKEELLTDISEWERLIIRGYLAVYVPAWRKWEIEGTFLDRRTGKTYEIDGDGSGKPLAMDMKPSGVHRFKRVLPLNDKQLDFLKKMILFNKAGDAAVVKKEKGVWQGQPLPRLFESETRSVGEFVARMLVDTYTTGLAQQDLEEIDKESP